MSLGQRLDLKLSQSLVMTPQLQQAIKLLQLNNVELSAFVEDELERNPLLTRADDQESSGDRTSASETEAERYDAPDRCRARTPAPAIP